MGRPFVAMPASATTRAAWVEAGIRDPEHPHVLWHAVDTAHFGDPNGADLCPFSDPGAIDRWTKMYHAVRRRLAEQNPPSIPCETPDQDGVVPKGSVAPATSQPSKAADPEAEIARIKRTNPYADLD